MDKFRIPIKRNAINRKTTRTEAAPLFENDQRFSFKPDYDFSRSKPKGKFQRGILANKIGASSNIKVTQLNSYVIQQLRNQQQTKKKECSRKAVKFQSISNKLSSLKSTAVSQKSLRINNQRQDKRLIPNQLYNEVKHVFKHLEVLKNYGFSQKKIVKWMNSFLSKKGQILCDIFMKSYLNKKSLSNAIIYERFTSLENIIERLQNEVSKLSYTEILFLINEIKHFKNYVQQIVIKKTQSNLAEMFNGDYINPMLKFCEDAQISNSAEIIHFIKDLKNIQDRYGQLETVSKFNRFMFKELLKAEQKFIDDFYTSQKQN